MKPEAEKPQSKLRHIGLIALALVVALGLWIYVVMVDDPDASTSLSNVPVTYANEGVFEMRELIVTGGQARGVDLSFRGSMSNLAGLTKENVTVTVDLAEIEDPGEYMMTYDVTLAKGSEGIGVTKQTDRVKVVVDRLDKKSVEFRLKGDITAEDEYMLKEPALSPAVLSVTGPAEMIEAISYAGVELLHTRPLSSTMDADLSFKLFDEDGVQIVSEHISTDVDMVHATFPVFRIKEVKLDLSVKSGGGLTEDNISCTFEPPSITVAGDAAVLDTFNICILETVHLANLTAPEERELEITLPNGLESVSGETRAKVWIDIHDVETRVVEVTPVVENFGQAGTHELSIHTKVIFVTLRGTPEALSRVSETSLSAVVDMEGTVLPAGTFERPVTISLSEETLDVGIVGEYKAIIELSPFDGE